MENGKEIAILRSKYLAPLVREGKEIAVMRGNYGRAPAARLFLGVALRARNYSKSLQNQTES